MMKGKLFTAKIKKKGFDFSDLFIVYILPTKFSFIRMKINKIFLLIYVQNYTQKCKSFRYILLYVKIINHFMEEQFRNETYRMIGAALPIQNKDPIRAKSLFNFAIQEPGQLKEIVKNVEELNKLNERYFNSKKNIHKIGDSLSELFRSPVYKSHELLKTRNNLQFASCKLSENLKNAPEHIQIQLKEDYLQFQSRFQSGNLAFATRSQELSNQYYLALQREINSESSTTQWFYFRIKNRQNTGIYSFNIVNCIKPFSMFKVGMKPCVYSVKQKKGWQRGCFNIEYRKNSIFYTEQKCYYTLSFSYQFIESQDQVYFAYCYPYSFTRLQRFLDNLQVKHNDKMRRKVIARTIANNPIEVISITNPQYLNKKLMFITARVHPGQTISSFVCEAIIQFVLSSDPEAQKLRDQFIIKIVPMVNPDGVIHGNYRTSLSGHDLNRQWKNPDKVNHPQIYYLKKLILESQYKKIIYIDIHGHSKKKSTFMYGCVTTKSPYIAKQFPFILSKQMQQFTYYGCNFAMPRSKEGTSRIVLFKNGIDFSYTYELSFCGPIRQRRHYNIKDYQTIGFQLSKTLSQYFYSRVFELEVDEVLQRRCQQFYDSDQLMNFGNEETDGSSSELQDEVFIEQKKRSKSPFKNKRSVRNHNVTERSDNTSLNNLLQNYLNKYQSSQKKDQSSHQIKQKKKVQEQIYQKQRQSFVATKVNIQDMGPQNSSFLSSMSSFYGLAIQKNSNSKVLQQVKSTSLKLNSRSFSYTQRKDPDSFGILLPNVQKSQYRRYQRYKRDKLGGGEKSVSFYCQNTTHLNQVTQNKIASYHLIRGVNQISLVQRIRSRTNDRRDTKF